MKNLTRIQASSCSPDTRCSVWQRVSEFRIVGYLILSILIINGGWASDLGSEKDTTQTFWENLWQSRVAQVQLLLATNPMHDAVLDSLYSSAIREIKAGNYQTGYELLEVIMELADSSRVVDSGLEEAENFELPDALQASPYQLTPFQIEMGYDESQYHTTTQFSDNDDLNGYQVKTPFTAIQVNQNFGSLRNQFSLQHRFRIDQQYINYFFRNYYQHSGTASSFRFDVSGDYFQNMEDSTNRYIDVTLELAGNSFVFSQWQFYFRTYYRAKRYMVSNSNFPQINQISGSVNGEWNLSFYHRLGIDINGENYREFQPDWNQYNTMRFQIYFRYAKTLRQNLEISAQMERRNFTTQLDSISYKNRFWEGSGLLSGEFPFYHRFSLGAKGEFLFRTVGSPDEFTPDEQRYSIEINAKFYWGSLNYFGIGFWQENQKYEAPQEDANNYVKSFNRVVQGVAVYLNYFDSKGKMITLESRFGKSRYPSAETNPFPTLYSDSRFYFVNLTGWLPVTDHIQLQAMANYSNETSLIYENTTAKGRTFSLSIIYQW